MFLVPFDVGLFESGAGLESGTSRLSSDDSGQAWGLRFAVIISLKIIENLYTNKMAISAMIVKHFSASDWITLGDYFRIRFAKKIENIGDKAH